VLHPQAPDLSGRSADGWLLSPSFRPSPPSAVSLVVEESSVSRVSFTKRPEVSSSYSSRVRCFSFAHDASPIADLCNCRLPLSFVQTSSATQSPTPSIRSARLSLPSMSSTPSSVREELSTVSATEQPKSFTSGGEAELARPLPTCHHVILSLSAYLHFPPFRFCSLPFMS
jgi:hypothetical protein